VDLLQGANSPDAAAWTPLSTNTLVSNTDNGNYFQETIGVYRANSSNTSSDYYMITKKVDSQPHYSGCTWGGTCGWYTTGRWLNIQTDVPAGPAYALTDHGPTTANGSTTDQLTVGASISGLIPNVSAAYSVAWNVQNVSTSDNTNLATNVASWTESFDMSWHTWTANVPAAESSLYESDQAAIYAVPPGTSAFNVTVQDQVNFQYDTAFGYNVSQTNINTFVHVEPPSLSVSPTSLTVLPGQHVTFNITAQIPAGSGQNLSWNISNMGSLNLNTTTGAGNQTISFIVPSSATPGLLATLNIDTSPQYASPAVRTGPIQLPITIAGNMISAGVLITGGTNWTDPAPMNTAEVWNPATQTSTAVGNMTDARVFHTATPVANNQIFIAGGVDGTYNPTNTTEFFNEKTQQFTPGPSLNQARAGQTATLLNDGTVLLVGGYDINNNALSSAEIYNPASNTITLTGSMSTGRAYHSATLLADGRVLILGGSGSAAGSCPTLATAEIYNPQTKTFSPTGSYPYSNGTKVQAATLLTNGQVLVAGGNDCHGGAADMPILYTPSSGSFTIGIDNLTAYQYSPALISLSNGGAVLIGGGGTYPGSSWIFDPAKKAYGTLEFMKEMRDRPQAAMLENTNSVLDGQVVVAGGVVVNSGGTNGERIEVYNPASNTWATAGMLTTARSGNTATFFGAVNSITSGSHQ
jgi:hypothetical protein